VIECRDVGEDVVEEAVAGDEIVGGRNVAVEACAFVEGMLRASHDTHIS
jgi:hypothetical protein